MNMRCLLLIVFAASCVLPLGSEAADCDGPEGSSAWAGCMAFNSFEQADKKLNAVYRKLVAATNKPEWQSVREKLIASQRAWVVFRDKDCALDQELSGGANKAPGLDCQTEMTKERTSYLQGVLEDFQ